MIHPLRADIVAGEPELHSWCPVCLLSIRLRIPLHFGDVGGPLAAVLEICPGCGTGHDRPSVTATAAPRQPLQWNPLLAVAHAAHRWVCGRTGRISRVCAHGDCRWPGLYRHEHTIAGDEGTWRYVFCTRRHHNAWAARHGIHRTGDAG